MIMLCYKNGSVAREHIRNGYFKLKNKLKNNWDDFNKILNSTPAGNNGILGFYFIESEIIPPCKSGIYRFDKNNNKMKSNNNNTNNSILECDIRGIVESQFMSMRSHMESIGLNLNDVNNIIATGGAAQNTTMLQVLSDVFNANVKILQSKSSFDTAMKGAALRAWHGYLCNNNNNEKKGFISFKQVVDQIFDEKKQGQTMYKIVAKPNKDNFNIYTQLMKRRNELEQKLATL